MAELKEKWYIFVILYYSLNTCFNFKNQWQSGEIFFFFFGGLNKRRNHLHEFDLFVMRLLLLFFRIILSWDCGRKDSEIKYYQNLKASIHVLLFESRNDCFSFRNW